MNAAANLRHGEFTRAKIAKRREEAQIAKRLRDRLGVVEQNLKACGVFD